MIANVRRVTRTQARSADIIAMIGAHMTQLRTGASAKRIHLAGSVNTSSLVSWERHAQKIVTIPTEFAAVRHAFAQQNGAVPLVG